MTDVQSMLMGQMQRKCAQTSEGSRLKHLVQFGSLRRGLSQEVMLELTSEG